jgi:hypothetical protein
MVYEWRYMFIILQPLTFVSLNTAGAIDTVKACDGTGAQYIILLFGSQKMHLISCYLDNN